MNPIRIPGAATRIAASAALLIAASFAFSQAAHPGAATAPAAAAASATNAAQPGTPGTAASQGASAVVGASEPKSGSATSPAPPDVAATIKKALESRFKTAHVLDVQATAVPNIYEVYVGDRVVYSTASGDYVFIGSLVDTRTHTDLSKMSMDRRNTIDFKALPFDKAIKVVKGNGSRALAVFEDPDCPYCQRLEGQLKSVTNLTEYVFLYPIDELHPQATAHSHAIWCAPDRAKAWTDWLLEKKAPPAASPAATCKSDPIAELGKLGDNMHITGTPTLFTSNGQRIDGAISASDIEKILVDSPTPASATAPAAKR